jgi:hypothetical protein
LTLPDPRQSRAVLIGVSEFTSLEPLPAVRRSLDALAECLRDRELWGLPARNCTVLAEPASQQDVGHAVDAAAEQAADTLLVYYSGHGVIDLWNAELLLALPGTIVGKSYTAVPYEWVRRAVRDSPARRRLVILDCCYSGRALGTMGDSTSVVADSALIEGSAVLASAPENSPALAPPGEDYTAFTGALVDLLRRGDANGQAQLDLDTIFRHLRDRLRARSLPIPQMRVRDTAGTLPLVHNRAWRPPQPATKPTPRPKKSGKKSKPKHAGPLAAQMMIGNRYELIERLDAGDSDIGDVYRGRDRRLGRDVAVMLAHADRAGVPWRRQQLVREATSAAALNHPAIVAIYDAGETVTGTGKSVVFIVTELVNGQTLKLVLSKVRLPPQRAVKIAADVCAALEFSHQKGILHRDIKPSNIMLTADGGAKVKGFGLAATAGAAHSIVNAAAYMSPENARGDAPDARSDIYSLGCVLFEMLTGQPPFAGDSAVALAMKHVREQPPRPSTLNPQVGPDLDRVVSTALAKFPGDRYRSAAALRSDLLAR